MAKRPSTADILASARATDGKRGGAATALTEPPEKTRKRSRETPLASDPEERLTIQNSSHVQESAPPSVASMVESVREAFPPDRRSQTDPPSIASMLREIRGDRDDSPAVPPSVARMLADVRGVPVAQANRVVSRAAATANSSKAADPEKRSGDASPRPRSTAEIMAAARRQRGPGKTESGVEQPAETESPKPAASRPSGTAAILAAARRQGAVGERSGSPKTAEKPSSSRPTSTSAILAAARTQGAVDGGSAKPSSSSQKKAETEPASEATDERPRPPRISEILSRVRCDSGEDLAPLDLPPLAEMVAELRRQGALQHRQESAPRDSGHWTARIRDWFRGRGNRIAVRQFDHS